MENLTLTAVPGLLAGHWTHPSGTTGVTAVLTPAGARGAVFVPGSAPGSRELLAMEPRHLAGGVHGVCLSGGSAFGLAAADGVMRWLAERGHGFPTGRGPIPIVPAAILFDLHTATARPDAEGGYAAAAACGEAPLAEGRVGAGAGAKVAGIWGIPHRGGVGGAAEVLEGGAILGVAVALNAAGSARDPDTGRWITGPPIAPQEAALSTGAGQQTTLAVVATDAPFTAAQLQVIARMAAAGMARALYPAFSPFDGDLIFALSTAPVPAPGPAPGPAALAAAGHAAAGLVARSVLRAVGPPIDPLEP
jgi:L-aminopeptidase/D-esterase-like protein